MSLTEAHLCEFMCKKHFVRHFVRHFGTCITRRWDAADHVLLTELQALTTASMTASSRAHGPHLETKQECSEKRTNASSKDLHTNLILPCFNRCQVDPSKYKAWIKTGQLYSKLFKVNLALWCSSMHSFLLLQISDASQDMDRCGLFQVIWTWPRDLHFDGRQQRIIWCKNGLLVSEDGPMPWLNVEKAFSTENLLTNHSQS